MQVIRCEAALFDLDGVLVNSDYAVVQSWRDWADLHHLSLEQVLAHAYGRRSRDTIMQVAPHLDAELETARITEIEFSYIPATEVFENAQNLLIQLSGCPHAIVTSGTLDLASARLRQCQLPIPAVFITADDVINGKPSPEGYLLAAQRLGKAPHTCVVIEDSPAGLQAAKTAGMKAIAVATTHHVSALTVADLIVPELKQLVLAVFERHLEFTAPDINL